MKHNFDVFCTSLRILTPARWNRAIFFPAARFVPGCVTGVAPWSDVVCRSIDGRIAAEVGDILKDCGGIELRIRKISDVVVWMDQGRVGEPGQAFDPGQCLVHRSRVVRTAPDRAIRCTPCCRGIQEDCDLKFDALDIFIIYF